MRATILAYIEQIINIGKVLSDAMSVSLGLSEGFLREEYLSPEPISIVRCFKYVAPDNQPEDKPAWGIGEHTGAYQKSYNTRFITINPLVFLNRFRLFDSPEPRRTRATDPLTIQGVGRRPF